MGEGSTSPEQKLPQQPLTLDMIKPTPDNKIPVDGFLLNIDDQLGRLYDNFSKNPQDLEARFDYLQYIAERGDDASALTYLSDTTLPDFPQFSDELRLKELQLLADLFMNAAEAARRRNEFWKSKGEPQTENPLQYLNISLKYQQEAKKLKEKLEKSQQV